MPATHPISRARSLGFDIELRSITNDAVRFPAHWHDDLQVIATLGGVGEARLGRRQFELRRGSLLVVPPKVAHTARASSDSQWTFHSLHVDPARLPGKPAAGGLLHDDHEAARLFSGVVRALFGGSAQGNAAQLFDCFLTTLSIDGPDKPIAPEAGDRARMDMARARLEDRANDDQSLGRIARSFALSEAHFSRCFSRAFGLPPHAWRLVSKVENAKAALRKGTTVAFAQKTANFKNPAAFSRAFRKFTGLSPRTYRAWFAAPG